MAYRDNTKSMTPSLKAASGGASKTLNHPARAGKRKTAGAGPVNSENGKTPRPGGKEFKPAGGGYGSIARPGGNQKIKG